MFCPSINIREKELLNFLLIYNYDIKCKSKELNKKVIISKEYCHDCPHYEHCIIWNDENFLKFYKEHKYCERCNYQQEILDKGYAYICWKLKKKGFLPEQFQFQCCSCRRLKD